MGTLGWVIAGAALGLVAPFVVLQFQRRRDIVRAGAATPTERKTLVRPGNPFAAVSIRACAESPCEAVLRMQGRRYLAVRAPGLPVPGCGRGQCGCRYVRHADRRARGERRDQYARFGGLTPAMRKERRANAAGRRKSPSR